VQKSKLFFEMSRSGMHPLGDDDIRVVHITSGSSVAMKLP